VRGRFFQAYNNKKERKLLSNAFFRFIPTSSQAFLSFDVSSLSSLADAEKNLFVCLAPCGGEAYEAYKAYESCEAYEAYEAYKASKA